MAVSTVDTITILSLTDIKVNKILNSVFSSILHIDCRSIKQYNTDINVNIVTIVK